MTLLIGQPFYENLSEKVDRDMSPDGTAPESGLPLWRELWISARDSLRIVVRAACWAVLLFALGFIPVVGHSAYKPGTGKRRHSVCTAARSSSSFVVLE